MQFENQNIQAVIEQLETFFALLCIPITLLRSTLLRLHYCVFATLVCLLLYATASSSALLCFLCCICSTLLRLLLNLLCTTVPSLHIGNTFLHVDVCSPLLHLLLYVAASTLLCIAVRFIIFVEQYIICFI